MDSRIGRPASTVMLTLMQTAKLNDVDPQGFTGRSRYTAISDAPILNRTGIFGGSDF